MRRPTRRHALAVTAAACLGLFTGCESGTKPVPPSPPVGKAGAAQLAPRSTAEYRLVGVVRGVEPGLGRVTIRHEKVPGFMDAMTMPFTLKDPKDLEDVRPGDEVKATLKVERAGGEVESYELRDLVVTRQAPPEPLRLNLSEGQVRLAPKVLQPGDLVPDFAMTDQDGVVRRLSDFRGKVVALTFIFTRCPLPDFCPRMDRKFSDLAERIRDVPGRAENARLLSVSFDPAHDTPAVLKAHARARGASPPLWTFAVASHAELSRVAGPLGLVYGPSKNDDVIHNLVVAVIDPGGRLARLETGEAARSWDAADVLKSMHSWLSRTTK